MLCLCALFCICHIIYLSFAVSSMPDIGAAVADFSKDI